MQFHEEVYTSAPELLDSGSSHLGVVARSRGFPMELESTLCFHRSYSIFRESATNGVGPHPPRVVISECRGKKPFYCVTHVVYGRADHTGRACPLAHHLLFDIEEMRAEKISAASLLASAGELVYREWQGAPRWIENLRCIDAGAYPMKEGGFPSSSWLSLVNPDELADPLAALIDGLMQFPRTARSVVLCVPVSASTLAMNLMADVLAGLPSRLQTALRCVSHVVEESDSIQGSALLLTYPGTRFLAKATSRQDPNAPVVVDLAKSSRSRLPELQEYGAAIRRSLRSQHAGRQVRHLRGLYEELQFDDGDSQGFECGERLFNRIQEFKSCNDVANIGAEIQSVRATLSGAEGCIEKWCSQLVAQCPTRLAADECWLTLVALFAVEKDIEASAEQPGPRGQKKTPDSSETN